MRWLELTVEADVEAVEPVSEILGRVSGGGTAVQATRLVRDPDDEMSAREDTSAPFIVTAHVVDDSSASVAVEATERALWHLQAFNLRPVGPLRVRAVGDADWTDAWKRDHVTQRIGRVVIVPSWIHEPPRPGDLAIHLDPGMAFGTGLHPTTRACLEILQAIAPLSPTALDVGCGSGILSLAALRLGAGRVDGLDTDPVAVEVARANAERNGLTDRFEARIGTISQFPARRYPLILANLVAAVLVDLAPALAAHLEPRGTLLASGIIEPREREVLDALAGADLSVVERRVDGEWVSLRASRAA